MSASNNMMYGSEPFICGSLSTTKAKMVTLTSNRVVSVLERIIRPINTQAATRANNNIDTVSKTSPKVDWVKCQTPLPKPKSLPLDL